MTRIKILWLCLCSLMVFACSASPPENVGEMKEALCSGPPVATGTVGTASASPYITTIAPWIGPPAEVYSANVSTSALTNGKISWGSLSDTSFRTTGCAGFDGACVAWPATPDTKLRIFNGTNDDGALFTSFYVNGVKVAELLGANANTSLQNTKTYSGGLTRIRQDTGSNSRFYFEGWNNGVFIRWSARFFNSCGSIN